MVCALVPCALRDSWDLTRLVCPTGLSVHLNQVHKETLTQVENALPNRQGLEVEIFGMEGIPQEILDQHRNRIIQNFYQAQEDRRIATGNPLPGQAMKRKKIQMETAEELKKRLAEYREQKKAAGTNGPMEGVVATHASPASFVRRSYCPTRSLANLIHTQNQQPYGQQPGFPAAQPTPGGAYGQPPYGYSDNNLPSRPSGAPVTTGLPPRPAQGGPAAPSDDIDQLIRMAEAGIKPTHKPEEDMAGDRKGKKEKKSRMFYDDAETSPEERMAVLPRYAFAPEIAA